MPQNDNREGRPKFQPMQGNGFVTKYSATRKDAKRELQKIILAHSDIHAAYQASRHFLNIINIPSDQRGNPYAGMDHPLYTPLLSAVVVSYAKPFTDNQGLGVLKKCWREFSDPKWARCHERVLKARHEMFAHSDASVRRVEICPPGEKKFLGGRQSVGIGYSIRGYGLAFSEMETIAALSFDLARRLHSEAERLIEKLYGGMELPRKNFPLQFDHGF